MKDAIISIMATAIRDMRINHPDTGDGTTRDNLYEGNENSVPLAKAVIFALHEAGYEIVRRPVLGDAEATASEDL